MISSYPIRAYEIIEQLYLFILGLMDVAAQPFQVNNHRPELLLLFFVAVVWKGEVSKKKKKKRVELFQAALTPELILPRPNPVR